MTEKIFITGATGNVGREVVKNLHAAGTKIIAAALDEADAQRIPEGAHTEVAYFDFGKPEDFPKLLGGVTSLFLMRPPHIEDVQTYLFPLIDAGGEAGVKRIVFLSLMGIEDSKWAPHYAVEKYLESSGIPYIFLRPSFYMQNFSGPHAIDIRARNEILLPAGRGKNSFIDVRDIGEVAAKMLLEEGHDNKAYTLTGSEALDYFQAAQIFSEVLGREIKYNKPSPIRFHRHMIRHHSLPSKFVWVMQILYMTVRMGKGSLVTNTVAEILERPPITLRQFVKDNQTIWQSGNH